MLLVNFCFLFYFEFSIIIHFYFLLEWRSWPPKRHCVRRKKVLRVKSSEGLLGAGSSQELISDRAWLLIKVHLVCVWVGLRPSVTILVIKLTFLIPWSFGWGYCVPTWNSSKQMCSQLERIFYFTGLLKLILFVFPDRLSYSSI